MRRILSAAVGVIALFLMGGASAGAVDISVDRTSYELDIDAKVACGAVTLTFENPTPWFYAGDYRTDDEAPVSTDEFGDLWHVVNVDGREDVHEATAVVEVPEDSGEHIVSYRWARGAESDLYDPAQWWTAEVSSDCTPAEPTVTQPTCDCATGTLTIPSQDDHAYQLEGQPIAAGDHELTAGTYTVDAYSRWAPEAPAASWELTINEPPSDDECNPGTDDGTEDGGEQGTDDGAEDGADDGTDDGSEDGAEDGTDTGTENGSEDGDATGDDAGTESGSDDGSDDGTDGGTPTDDPTPTPSPTDDEGDEDGTGNDADGDENLPDTGGNGPWMALAGGSAMLVGVVTLVLLRRRVGVQGGNL